MQPPAGSTRALDSSSPIRRQIMSISSTTRKFFEDIRSRVGHSLALLYAAAFMMTGHSRSLAREPRADSSFRNEFSSRPLRAGLLAREQRRLCTEVLFSL